jgi:hypothetical protein
MENTVNEDRLACKNVFRLILENIENSGISADKELALLNNLAGLTFLIDKAYRKLLWNEEKDKMLEENGILEEKKVFTLENSDQIYKAILLMTSEIKDEKIISKNHQIVMGIADSKSKKYLYQVQLVLEADEERFLKKNEIQTRGWR